MTYFSGCVSDKKDIEKPLSEKQNPYKKLLPKKLPDGFEMSKEGYPIYFSPETPIEFREVFKDHLNDKLVEAYINSARYKESKILAVNERIEKVGAKMIAREVSKQKAAFKNNAKDIVAVLWVNVTNEKEDGSEFIKVLNLLKKYGASISAVDYRPNDRTLMNLFGGKDIPMRDYKSRTKIAFPITKRNKKKAGLPILLIKNRSSNSYTRILGMGENMAETAVTDFVVKTGRK